MGSRLENRTRSLTLIATLAVVYTVLRVIPTFPMVGVPGSRFTSSDFVASLYGVILGAYSGAFCIVLGTFIAFLLGRPPVFLGLDFLPAVVNAFVVGLIVRGRRGYAILIYLLLLAAFLGHPYGATLVRITPFWGHGSLTFPFVWLHIIGLVLLLSPAGLRLGRLIACHPIRLNAAGFSLLSLVGTLAQHLTGNLLYASIILPMLSEEARAASWALIFWLYPVERITIVVLSTIAGVPIIRAVRSSSFVHIKGGF
ncbi:hypothetical protein KEJ39_09140 [Candidatus Bathyarchaeota archaeon]|nr:hypothetical protein [Candidatus Bathyarchaeota archaeon]